MDIGVIIRGYRRGRQLTQEELASGICSISHLSKIENGSKEYNEETITLLLQRLDIDLNKIQNEINFFQKLLDELYKTIVYQDYESAKQKFSIIQGNNEKLILIGLNHLNEIISYRYYLFIQDSEKYIELRKKLLRNCEKFSQIESVLFSYFDAIYFILEGQLKKALELFSKLLDKSFQHFGDFYYHLALCMSLTHNPGAAILYSNKALEQYDIYNNFTRKIHTQMILAINYQRIGALLEAEHYYELLLTNSTRINDLKNIAYNSHNLSILKKAQKQFSKAVFLLQKSIQAAKEARVSYLPSLCELAEIYESQNETETSVELIKQIIIKAKEEGNLRIEIKYLYKQQHLSLSINHFANFIEKRGFTPLEAHHLFEDMVLYCTKLIHFYQEKQDLQKKIKYLEYANLALYKYKKK
ncbi:helix-turn-helix domain-containing protein [Bacillus salitolerans]|uniref:Helix-turn-helix domain-containing protein n=1 Tax=Bacillus salitolerans TaxID=1437434 RepID=A0ABW4LQ74_9BACI